MIRIFSILAGLFFSAALLWSLGKGVVSYISEPPAMTVEHEFHTTPRELTLASDGAFGRFDKQQLQRGFQVYKEVCSACHPFFTGKQKLMDTAGRVERFKKRYGQI